MSRFGACSHYELNFIIFTLNHNSNDYNYFLNDNTTVIGYCFVRFGFERNLLQLTLQLNL